MVIVGLLLRLATSCPTEGMILGKAAQSLREGVCGSRSLSLAAGSSWAKHLGSPSVRLSSLPCPVWIHFSTCIQGVNPAGYWWASLPKGKLRRETEQDKLRTCSYHSGGHSSLTSSAGTHRVLPSSPARRFCLEDARYVNCFHSPLCTQSGSTV